MNKEAVKIVKDALIGLRCVDVYNDDDDSTGECYYLKNDIVKFRTFYLFAGKQSDLAIIINADLWNTIQTKFNMGWYGVQEIFEYVLNKKPSLIERIGVWFNRPVRLSFSKIRILGPMDDKVVNGKYRSQIGKCIYPIYKRGNKK